MKHTELEAMPLNDLWEFHETVISVLSSKIEIRKHELERRLDEIGSQVLRVPKR